LVILKKTPVQYKKNKDQKVVEFGIIHRKLRKKCLNLMFDGTDFEILDDKIVQWRSLRKGRLT
jgi:hypothetical protein